MEKPTPPQNHPAVVGQQPPEVSREQAPPNYENREFSSPLAQPPLTNPSSPTPAHQYGGNYQQDPNGFPPQSGFPPQTHAPQQHGLSSIPIQNLQSQSAPVVCPSCNARAMTVTTPESGGLTHAIAAAVCLVSCLGCIPYCISSLKDVHHKCGNCGIPLADFHRSGRTEVLGWQK